VVKELKKICSDVNVNVQAAALKALVLLAKVICSSPSNASWPTYSYYSCYLYEAL
jgi:hypothetical protein